MKSFIFNTLTALGVAGPMLLGATPAPSRAQDLSAATAMPASSAVTVLGDADDVATVRFQVALAMRNATELRERLTRGEDMSNAAERARRYLPTETSHAGVLAWLMARGFTVTQTYANRLTIEATGSAAAVRRAFGVALQRVAVNGAELIATASAPAVPAALAGEVVAVNGLQPHIQLHRLARLKPSEAAATTDVAAPGVLLTGNYLPGALLRVYQAQPYLPYNGQGTRTAILIDTFPHLRDLAAFWKQAGISQTIDNVELEQAVPGQLARPSGEETVDAEYAGGIGYGSKVRIYATVSLMFSDIDTGLQTILADLDQGVPIQQLSISLGLCEGAVPPGEFATENNLFSLIAAQGVSIFVASGDLGAKECGSQYGIYPSFPATSPFVTAVGGTHLIARGTAHGATLAIKSETGWTGSGGGLSAIFPTPAYQAGLGTLGRATPDVAVDADPATGVVMLLEGVRYEVGGTSVSTPVLAGFASLINEARIAAGKPPLGQLNPRIYPLLGTSSFHDTTSGCNHGYCAGPGYDLVTGLGSPVMDMLLPVLLAQP